MFGHNCPDVSQITHAQTLPLDNLHRWGVEENVWFKDGAYFCYCAYVLRISRYSGFLWVVLTNTGIFLCSLKLCGESGT